MVAQNPYIQRQRVTRRIDLSDEVIRQLIKDEKEWLIHRIEKGLPMPEVITHLGDTDWVEMYDSAKNFVVNMFILAGGVCSLWLVLRFLLHRI